MSLQTIPSSSAHYINLLQLIERDHPQKLILFLSKNRLPDKERGAAVIIATRIGSLRQVQILLSNFSRLPPTISVHDRSSAIIQAASDKKLDILHYLIDDTISVSFRGLAVIEAAKNNDTDAVQILLANGPISSLDSHQALIIAHNNGNQLIIDLLFHP